ncbi:MAG: metallophosphoesterase [Kiritimatiellia bacterium]
MNINRRVFIKGVVASTAWPLFAGQNSEFDDNLVALLADTHIPGSVSPEYQRDGLIKTVADILLLRPLPRNVLILGDFAYLFGKKEDYAAAAEIIAPLSGAGIRVTIAMGNHDRRAPFLERFPEYAQRTQVPGRIVSTVQTPHADFILLDSLDDGKVAGRLDDAQKEWLDETLKNYQKPVFVTAHHPFRELGISKTLTAYPATAGYLNGHNHVWRRAWIKRNWQEHYILRTLELPSTGHWGDIGYALMRIRPGRAVAELRQRDFFYPKPAKSAAEAPPEWAAIVEENKGQTCTFFTS